ncbi:MAG TPA: hypothetical protein VLO10_06665, partial [Candidatus Deferrimicrobium sp.]|nr:hypothetical protein [Candidatus Deferrimicrobium sp.]
MPRPGRTLAVAVYRPFAEQLAGIAGTLDGLRVLELPAGDGELTARLRHAVGEHGSLEVSARPWSFIEHADHFDVALSLLAIDGQEELQSVLPQLGIVARRVHV